MVSRVVTEGVFVRRGLSPFAVLVFSVVGLVGFLVLVSVGSEPGPASEATVAPIVGVPVPEPPPIESFDSLSWSRVSDYPAIFGRNGAVFMVSVAAAGPGLVAAGSGLSGLWTSFDGITWDKVPYVEAFGTGGINSVTGGGPGLVAVGSGIWSFDGIIWTRRVESGLSYLFSVVAGGPGLVAVGEVGEGPSEFEEYWDADAAVWSSVDGTNWTRIPHDESVFGGTGRQFMSVVTVGGPGLVAVGGDHSDDGGSDAAVWTSVNGISWTRVLHDEAVLGGEGSQTMSSVTAGGPGLVAVGSSEGDAAVWTSPDGITWTRVHHDGSAFADSHMSSVTTAGPGVVAVGYTGSVLRDAAVWTSIDGINWTRVPHNESAFGDGYMSGVTAGGPGPVVVGESGGSGAAVWVAQPEN